MTDPTLGIRTCGGPQSQFIRGQAVRVKTNPGRVPETSSERGYGLTVGDCAHYRIVQDIVCVVSRFLATCREHIQDNCRPVGSVECRQRIPDQFRQDCREDFIVEHPRKERLAIVRKLPRSVHDSGERRSRGRGEVRPERTDPLWRPFQWCCPRDSQTFPCRGIPTILQSLLARLMPLRPHHPHGSATRVVQDQGARVVPRQRDRARGPPCTAVFQPKALNMLREEEKLRRKATQPFGKKGAISPDWRNHDSRGPLHQIRENCVSSARVGGVNGLKRRGFDAASL